MVDKLGEPPLAPWRELTLGGYLRAHRSGLRWGGPPRPPRYLPMQAKRAPLLAGLSLGANDHRCGRRRMRENYEKIVKRAAAKELGIPLPPRKD